MIVHRMKAGLLAVFLLFTMLASPPGSAFEIETHVRISEAAFALSSASERLRDLGIDSAKLLNGGFLRGSKPPVEWLSQGSQDEDDTLS